jgi:hypothetical protein
VIKEAMALVGRGNGIARAPISGLSEEKKKSLRKILAAIVNFELKTCS